MKTTFPAIAAICVILLPLSISASNGAKSVASQKELRILLVGDSTVTHGAGWGQGFKSLAGERVVYLNHAKGGRASKSYRDEGHWDKALKTNADYVLLQLGHNDQTGKGPARETDPETTYRQNMARYVAEASRAGMKPILVTSLTRRYFLNGKIINTDFKSHALLEDQADLKSCPPSERGTSLPDYVNAVRKLAEEEDIPLIELYQPSVELANKLGPEGCREISPKQSLPTGKPDCSHLNARGSRMIAKIVVLGFLELYPELAPYFPTVMPSSKTSWSVKGDRRILFGSYLNPPDVHRQSLTTQSGTQ